MNGVTLTKPGAGMLGRAYPGAVRRSQSGSGTAMKADDIPGLARESAGITTLPGDPGEAGAAGAQRPGFPGGRFCLNQRT